MQRGGVWWSEFWFAGRRIRDSATTASKTVAQQAEDVAAAASLNSASIALQIPAISGF